MCIRDSFETLNMLTLAMVFIFIATIPTMGIYATGNGIVNDSYGFITQFSLGNMGEAAATCKSYPSTKYSLSLSCDSGQIDSSQMTTDNFGLISSTSETTNYCLYDSSISEMSDCDGFIDKDTFLSNFTSTCNGLSSCTFNIDTSWYTNGTDSDNCVFSDSATLFLQYGCAFSESDLNTRQVEGLYVGCIGVFTALFFVVFIDYISSVFKNSFVEWDVKTITAGDYTCELTISQSMWNLSLIHI